MRMDRQTDMTNAIVIFHDSVNAPEKGHYFPAHIYNGYPVGCCAAVGNGILSMN